MTQKCGFFVMIEVLLQCKMNFQVDVIAGSFYSLGPFALHMYGVAYLETKTLYFITY